MVTDKIADTVIKTFCYVFATCFKTMQVFAMNISNYKRDNVHHISKDKKVRAFYRRFIYIYIYTSGLIIFTLSFNTRDIFWEISFLHFLSFTT